MVLALAAAGVPAVVAVAWAGEDEAAGPTPVLETEPLFDDDAGGNADADDPSIWKHPTNPGSRLIVGTAKDGGLRVFDLRVRTVQSIPAPPAPGKDHAPGRFNNVDVAYGVKIGGKRWTWRWSAIAAATTSGPTRSTRRRRRRGRPRCAT
jgi:3-phytase